MDPRQSILCELESFQIPKLDPPSLPPCSMLCHSSRQFPLLSPLYVSLTTSPLLPGDIFSPLQQHSSRPVVFIEDQLAMTTKISEQPDGCWDVHAICWSSNTQHFPPVPEMSSPGPRQSRSGQEKFKFDVSRRVRDSTR